MDTKVGLVLGVLALVSIGSIGCSSGGGDGPSHGVSPSKKLNTLTQQEIDEICENIESRMTSVSDSISSLEADDDLMCTAEAIFTTQMMDGTTADCESVKQQCLEESQQRKREEDRDESSGDEEIPCRTMEELADCEATVGDIDDCFNAYISEMTKAVKQAKAEIDKISCSNLEVDLERLEDMASDIPDMEDIPACQAVDEQCPGVMDLSSEMPYSGPAETASR